jgi:soluble lytic murein transglycosylase-like protein
MNPYVLVGAGTMAGAIGAGLTTKNRSLWEKMMNAIKNGTDWLADLAKRGQSYIPMFKAAESKYGIPTMMLARLAWQESRYRLDIITGKTVSRAGAVGIMQIVPAAHTQKGADPDRMRAIALDPPRAIDYAGQYLAQLKKQFGTWELALKAYNWGPGNVKKMLNPDSQVQEPSETRNYSAQIMADVRLATGASLA